MSNWLFGLKCPDCGKRITEDDQYCPHCGVDLDASNEQSSKTVAQQYLEKAQKNYERGTFLKAALSNCDQAIQYDPNSPAAYNLRGLILDALGKIDEAIASYEQAICLDPNFEEAKENLQDAEADRRNKPVQASNISPNQGNWLKVAVGVVSLLAFAICFAGSYLLYTYGRPYLGPKTTLIFEPDYSQISKADPADLEKTAQLLTDRAHFLGYTKISFRVAQDGTIIGKVPGYIDAESLAKRIKAIGLLEFVDFGKTHIPLETLVRTDLDHKYLQQAEGTPWHTIMTSDAIAAVYVDEDSLEAGNYRINFTLTPKGGEIFSQYTTENIGSYLGIVLDKVVISTPRINGPIPAGQGMINGDFTKEAAEELAMYLRMSPLPIPLTVRLETNSGK